MNVIEGGHGRTPLHEACYKGHFEVVQLLLQHHANIHQPDLFFWITPLHYACDRNNSNPSLVKMLLENGASVDVKDRYGETPLHYACSNGNLKVLQELLKYKPNINAVKKFGRNYTPLIKAVEMAWGGQTDIVEELLKHGADMDYIDFEYGYGTALHAAIADGNDRIVETFLKNGCNTKFRARFICDEEEIPNCTPFELALNMESIKIAKTIAFYEI